MIRAREYQLRDDRAGRGDRFAWLMWGYEHCADRSRRSRPATAGDADRDRVDEPASGRPRAGDSDVEEIAL